MDGLREQLEEIQVSHLIHMVQVSGRVHSRDLRLHDVCFCVISKFILQHVLWPASASACARATSLGINMSPQMQALAATYPEDGALQFTSAEQAALDLAAALTASNAHPPTAESPHAETARQAAEAGDAIPQLSGTLILRELSVSRQALSLHFTLPAGYPAAGLPRLQVDCACDRWILSGALVSLSSSQTIPTRDASVPPQRAGTQQTAVYPPDCNGQSDRVARMQHVACSSIRPDLLTV